MIQFPCRAVPTTPIISSPCASPVRAIIYQLPTQADGTATSPNPPAFPREIVYTHQPFPPAQTTRKPLDPDVPPFTVLCYLNSGPAQLSRKKDRAGQE